MLTIRPRESTYVGMPGWQAMAWQHSKSLRPTLQELHKRTEQSRTCLVHIQNMPLNIFCFMFSAELSTVGLAGRSNSDRKESVVPSLEETVCRTALLVGVATVLAWRHKMTLKDIAKCRNNKTILQVCWYDNVMFRVSVVEQKHQIRTINGIERCNSSSSSSYNYTCSHVSMNVVSALNKMPTSNTIYCY